MPKVSMNSTGWPVYKGADDNKEAYMVDTSTAGVTYICHKPDAKRIIRRITTSNGVTTIEWTYGAWADRATLTYCPIEEAMEVDL